MNGVSPPAVSDALQTYLNGVTAATLAQESGSDVHVNEPQAFDGPKIDGRATNVRRFSPTQIASAGFLPDLYAMINRAYGGGHEARLVKLVKRDRLRYENQFLEELGNKPGTHTFVVQNPDTGQVLATATGKRWFGNVVMRDIDATRLANTWKRVGTVQAGSVVWELSTLAVDPNIQKQGLSRYLMELVEGEAKRQFKIEADMLQQKGEPFPTRLMMIIVTIKQKNYDLYSRRGFVQDYETSYPAGYMDSDEGFTVVNMSKSLEIA